jgi:hypothetical protein
VSRKHLQGSKYENASRSLLGMAIAGGLAETAGGHLGLAEATARRPWVGLPANLRRRRRWRAFRAKAGARSPHSLAAAHGRIEGGLFHPPLKTRAVVMRGAGSRSPRGDLSAHESRSRRR